MLEEIHLHSFFTGSDRAFQEQFRNRRKRSGISLPHLYCDLSSQTHPGGLLNNACKYTPLGANHSGSCCYTRLIELK